MEVWIPLAKLKIYFDGNRRRAVMGAEARKQNLDLLSGAAGGETFTPIWGQGLNFNVKLIGSKWV